MGLWTNSGLILMATAVQTPGAVAGVAFVGISPGCGSLASPLVSGTPYANLNLNGTLPANVAAGVQLTITDGTNTDTATVASPGASAGASSIPLSGYTAGHNFAANTTAVAPTPLASDTALYGETARVAVTATSAGASPGESLISAYFDGTQATAVYILVGYFGGSSATGTPGTGTLIAEDIQYWGHTLNADTNMYQGDGII